MHPTDSDGGGGAQGSRLLGKIKQEAGVLNLNKSSCVRLITFRSRKRASFFAKRADAGA